MPHPGHPDRPEAAAAPPGARAFRLRPLAGGDADWAARLVNACFAEHVGRVDPPPSALRETALTLGAQVAATGGLAAVAAGGTGTPDAPARAPGEPARKDEPGPAGVGVLLWSERDGGLYVGRLAVAPAWRGCGVARALLAAAEREAVRRNLPRLHLGTRLALAGNRRLFAACGFAEVAEHAHPGFAHPTWVELEKRLSARP